MNCTKCLTPAVTYIRYNGTYLCANHFSQYVEKRVHKDIRKQQIHQGVVAVALSGGKDSLAVLYLMHDIIEHHQNKELHAITVDEGIAGYRPYTLDVARKHCKQLGISHHVVSFKDTVGYTLDQICVMASDFKECTYCGVFRRQCLNIVAREIGARTLVMGHNLDDMAQSIFMNIANNDLERMARMVPHSSVQPGLIQRVVPLRSIPEKEVMLYALLRGLDILEDECPYAVRATRGMYRDLLDTLEDSHPGSRHSLLNSYLSLKQCLDSMFPPAQLQSCSRCDEPSSQALCRACELKETITVSNGLN